jgi:hypothetical protein
MLVSFTFPASEILMFSVLWRHVDWDVYADILEGNAASILRVTLTLKKEHISEKCFYLQGYMASQPRSSQR